MCATAMGVEKMIRLLSILLCVLLFSSPLKAHANLDHANSLVIQSYDLTDSACYIDLLIKIRPHDEFYTKLNQKNMERYPFDYAKLAQYLDDESYKSYSCHYKDVFTEMSIQKQHRDGEMLSENCFDLKQVTANLKQELVSAYSVVKDFYDKNRKFKIAVLNSEGEIIQTSEVIEMEVPDRGQIASATRYDIAKNECDYERTDDPRATAQTTSAHICRCLCSKACLS